MIHFPRRFVFNWYRWRRWSWLLSRSALRPQSQSPTQPPSNATALPDSGTASVSGTSTLHDWTVNGTTVDGAMQCSGPWTAAPPTIGSIQLSIPADSLKSTEGSGMDNTMYDALNMKASPLITYTLTHADLKSPPSPGTIQHITMTPSASSPLPEMHP